MVPIRCLEERFYDKLKKKKGERTMGFLDSFKGAMEQQNSNFEKKVKRRQREIMHDIKKQEAAGHDWGELQGDIESFKEKANKNGIY